MVYSEPAADDRGDHPDPDSARSSAKAWTEDLVCARLLQRALAPSAKAAQLVDVGSGKAPVGQGLVGVLSGPDGRAGDLRDGPGWRAGPGAGCTMPPNTAVNVPPLLVVGGRGRLVGT